MKILMVSGTYLPNIGGIESHIFYLSRALQQMGHEVVILHHHVLGQRDKIESKIEKGIRVYRVFERKQKTVKPLWLRPAATVKGIKRVADDFGQIDILHQHDYYDSTLAVSWTNHGRKRIWTNHSPTFVKHFAHYLLRHLVRLIYFKFDGILAVSQELYQKSHALWGNRALISYIPNGVDADFFTPDVAVNRAEYGIGHKEFVVLCPTRITEQKGVLYLAQAAKILMQQHAAINWRFVFLGSDPAVNTDPAYINQVQNILDPYSRRGDVVYLGNVPMKQMPQLNALADVVVMPSLWEGFSLSALEAMASCTPLVTTTIQGMQEIVHHEKTGILVPPRDPQALAEAILKLYHHPKWRERVAQGGYRLVTAQYSWERVAEQTAMFYKKVLSR